MNEPLEVSLILNLLDELARRLDGKHVSPWLTTQEAANFLKCSTRQIDSLTDRGLLPFRRQDSTSPKSPRLYHRKHLTAYLIAGRNPESHRLSSEEKRLVEELL